MDSEDLDKDTASDTNVDGSSSIIICPLSTQSQFHYGSRDWALDLRGKRVYIKEVSETV